MVSMTLGGVIRIMDGLGTRPACGAAARRNDGEIAALAVSPLGTTGLLLSAEGELCLPTQQRIWALARETAGWPLVGEAVPGMNNLMLCFSRPPQDGEAWHALVDQLQEAWRDVTPVTREGRIVELDVSYGGIGGPHLADVIRHTGLSVEAVVALHSAPLYPVYALGSHPGYCYLGGMDPRLATPRRASPILNLPGGSVSIGGVQTGVSASAGPSGWNTIGHTEMSFFDPRRDPPAVLQPGDQIRFRVREVVA